MSDDGSALILEITVITRNDVMLSNCVLRLAPANGELKTWTLSKIPWDYNASISVQYTGPGTTNYLAVGDELRFLFPIQNKPLTGAWDMSIAFLPTNNVMFYVEWHINGSEAPGSVIVMGGEQHAQTNASLDGGQIIVIGVVSAGIRATVFALEERGRRRSKI